MTRKARTRASALLLALLSAGLTAASQESRPKEERWLEVRSPHFVVVSNAGENSARRAAGDFERIRAVFLKALEDDRDEFEPVVVLAVKDEEGLKELLPEYWEREGSRPDGIFQPGFDKHFVLVRLDGRTQARYQLIYHEYFHLLKNRGLHETPAWLNEGLAEFWGHTVIEGDTVEMGLPTGFRVFQRKSMLPLEELFGMDGNPHDTYPDKVSTFYLQSWALVHYILLGDETGTAKAAAAEYLRLVREKVDSVEAAQRAFGDLKKLEEALLSYVRSNRLRRLQMDAPVQIDEKTYSVRELSPADSAAMRAGFLAAGGHPQTALPLLEEALRLDPSNTWAQETMGFLHFYRQDAEEAKRWFAGAVDSGSRSYISHYYNAVLATENVEDKDAWARAERSLKQAVEINPTFGPGYGQLAYEYLRRGDHLEEALDIARRSVALEPGNVTYWLNTGHIFLKLNQHDEAKKVGDRLAAIATTEEERALATSYRDNMARYRPSGPDLATTVHYDGRGADIQPWIQKMTSAAERQWTVPESEEFSPGHVVLEASIRRNGDILELRIHASSGIPALDEAAEKALRRAVLPPLPDDYPDEVFEFILVFWYNEKPYDRT